VTYYSDNGVDALVESMLPEFGYACDVGANLGDNGTNTLQLEEKGWIVLCVEPNPLLEEHGRSKRKLWRRVACGVGDCDGQIFTAYDGWPHAGHSSLGDKSRYGVAGSPQAFFVDIRRVDRILEEAGFPRLDFLSIDVEGWELEVLAGFTVERWKPKVIVFEDYLGRYDYVKLEGYEFVDKLAFDRVYRRVA
jgi:FkbM family methyltransferase